MKGILPIERSIFVCWYFYGKRKLLLLLLLLLPLPLLLVCVAFVVSNSKFSGSDNSASHSFCSLLTE
jgi:hypothetical protein